MQRLPLKCLISQRLTLVDSDYETPVGTFGRLVEKNRVLVAKQQHGAMKTEALDAKMELQSVLLDLDLERSLSSGYQKAAEASERKVVELTWQLTLSVSGMVSGN